MDDRQLAVDLVSRLCQTLECEMINYCHWKSNASLQRSAIGENDLDLLVNRYDALQFIDILLRLGFKEAQTPQGEQLPGIRDYYGYDEQCHRLIHVHAHFQLVVGNDLSKNYHIPIEAPYLESAHQTELFRVPAPEFELAIFVIRMILKHATLDAILMGHGGLSDSECLELKYLQEKTSVSKVASVFERYLPSINHDLLDGCLQAIQPHISIWKRITVGDQITRVLKSCARRPQALDILIKFWRRVKLPILDRLHINTSKKRLGNGGLLIAIIGGDGAGKTTAVNSLYALFREEFEVKKVHIGKPNWSLTTKLVRGCIKIGRTLGLYPFMIEGSEDKIDSRSPSFPGYPWLIRETCTARDRYLTYRSARRLATNGCIVICDRYPVSEIKVMDGPQVERVTRGIKPNPMIKLLAKIEKHYYKQILSPDLLIALLVDPEISVKRKTDEPADSVRLRAGEVWNADWKNTPAFVLDASQSKSKVLTSLTKFIWDYI